MSILLNICTIDFLEGNLTGIHEKFNCSLKYKIKFKNKLIYAEIAKILNIASVEFDKLIFRPKNNGASHLHDQNFF